MPKDRSYFVLVARARAGDNNITARVEYLYVDLGSGSCSLVCFGTTTNVSFKTSLVRAGLDYKFGGF